MVINTGFLGIDLNSAGTTPYAGELNHDMCDAAIAAYTAFLYSQGKTELCGEPEEGTICLPFLDRATYAH